MVRRWCDVRRKQSLTSSLAHQPAGLSGFADIRPVATGGTSQVYRARQPAMDRVVAVKVISAAAADPRARARFERELAVTGRLSSNPLFVTIHGHGVSDAGYPYLVMPWYDGGSLADALRRGGPMPVPAAVALGVRLAAALDHLHGEGLVHRDVKPGNVLLTSAGDPVLADFGGAARERDAQTATTVVSPLHVAPEVLGGRAATARSDVWSLCSTLCTALAGFPPFVVAAPGGHLVRDMTRLDAAAPPLTRPDVPAALRDLLVAGLDPRPEQRPSARDVVTALRGVQASLGPPAVPTGTPSLPVPTGTPSLLPAAPAAAAVPIRVAGDATALRPPPATPPGPSWRTTAGLGAAGALAGAVMALGVLATGSAVLGPDRAGDERQALVEQVATRPPSQAPAAR